MPFDKPGPSRGDADGFGRPKIGGTLATKHANVTFEDTTAKALFTIPEGAVIVQWIANVSEAFNDGTAAVLDVGDGTIADRFAADLNVASVGQVVTGFAADELFAARLTEDVAVEAVYTGTADDATEGAATVAVIYYLAIEQ